MADWSIRRYQPEDKAAWDDVVRRSINGTFLHRRDYMDYHADRFPDRSWIIKRDNHPVAVFPATRAGVVVDSHAGLTYGGLVVTSEMTSWDILASLDLIADRSYPLVIRPIPPIYHTTPCEAELYWLWKHGRLIGRGISTVLSGRDVSPIPTRARQLKRVKDLLYQQVKPAVVYPLIEENLRTHHDRAPVHTLAELELLAGRFPHNIHCWAAFVEGEAVAGLVLYLTRQVVHCQYIAQSERGRETRAQDGLIAFTRRYYGSHPYYDFGVSTEQGGEILNDGLLAYKESFGGRSVCYDTWEVAL